MNARLDITEQGARVTRDGRTYQVSVTFHVEANDMDDARYWAADNLAALADMLMLAEGNSGPVIDDEAGKVGAWEIWE